MRYILVMIFRQLIGLVERKFRTRGGFQEIEVTHEGKCELLYLATVLDFASLWVRTLLPFQPNMRTDELYVESFVAVGEFGDGTFVQVQLAFTNVGPGSEHGVCRVILKHPNEAIVDKDNIVKQGQWHFNKDTGLHVGRCRMRCLGEKAQIHAEVDGIQVTIDVDAELQRTRLPKAMVVGNERDSFYSLDVLVSSASAQMALVEGNKSPQKLEGHVYIDHARSNLLPRSLAKRWIRFRSLDSKGGFLVLVREDQNGSKQGWTLSAQDGMVPIKNVRLASRGKDPKPAYQVLLSSQLGDFKLRSKQQLRRDAPVENHGFVGKMVGSLVGSPVAYTYKAIMHMKGSDQNWPGLLEIEEVR